ETDVSSFHRAALVTFDQWQCLVARDQDKEFVVSVIQAVQHVVQQAAEQSAAKPHFKLTPRKVKEANGKVFILLDSPVSDKQQIDILVDGCGDNQVSVKWKNAYTLYFILPENMLRVAKVMNISLICDTKHFMGTRPLKCETQMSELHGLLSSVNSPFEFMSQTLGFPTLSQFDEELANRFDQRLPYFGSVFAAADEPDVYDRQKSECYLPTLLHFASAYGLRELTSRLLHCPMALKACRTRNSSNLTPEQIAHHLNHTDIAALLRDFERLCRTHKANHLYDWRRPVDPSTPMDALSVTVGELTDQQKASLKLSVTAGNAIRYSTAPAAAGAAALSAHHQLYGLRLYSDLLNLKQNGDKLLATDGQSNAGDQLFAETNGDKRPEIMNNELPSAQALLDESVGDLNAINNKTTINALNSQPLVKKVNNTDATNEMSVTDDNTDTETDNGLKTMGTDSCDLNESQKELLNIIAAFKSGVSFVEFEALFDDWRQKYCNVLRANVSQELTESLQQIRNLCEIGRKQQDFEANKHLLNFNDLRYYLNSKLNHKLNDNNLKQTLHERLQLLSLNQHFCADSLSTSSLSSNRESCISTISTGSSSHDTIEHQAISAGNNAVSVWSKGSERTHSNGNINRLNRQNYKNNYYKRLKAKTIALIDKQNNESRLKANGKRQQSATDSRNINNNNAINSKSSDGSVGSGGGGSGSRPPAPPPRPLTVALINETNKAQEFNQRSIVEPSKVNIKNSSNNNDNYINNSSNHSEYYVFESVDNKSADNDDDDYHYNNNKNNNDSKNGKQLDNKLVSDETHNATQFVANEKDLSNERNDKCLNGVKVSAKRATKTCYRIKNNRLRDTVVSCANDSHEYENMSAGLGGAGSPSSLIGKRDPLIDYDLVPSGIPVPINSLRLTKKGTSGKRTVLKPVPECEYDYDIPKCSQQQTRDQIDGYFSSDDQSCDPTTEPTVDDNERQIFV
ncbi:unnamed protein product, partial [Medioppia subpectinata]